VFLFRRSAELDDGHRDGARQRQLLREVFSGEGWEVPRLLAEVDAAEDFYFDSISQIRMGGWSTGRVTLVGDAGYSPGPAVGGGTSLAAVGAYVLAGELCAAGADHAAGLRGYEREMAEVVRRSRSIGPAAMKTLIPRTPRQVWTTAQVMRLAPRLPATVQRTLFSLQGGPGRALGAVRLRSYPPGA
jgi:2-polyprenyl-6-methoxyphenol hydroxylase-like FAD-dependent oxidoreductase